MTTLILAALLSSTIQHRWFYVQTNLFRPEEATRVQGLLQRASKVGYNGMVLTDTKMQSQTEPPDFFLKNIRTVLDEAKRLKIEVIPVVLPVGYAGSMLANDPSLVEAMPARDVPFWVRNGNAYVGQASRPGFDNGDFERFEGDRMEGFAFQDGIGRSSFADHTTLRPRSTFGNPSERTDETSLRIENPGQLTETSGNCRLMQRVVVQPWQHYAITGWLKTENLERPGNVRLMALSPDGKPLSFTDLPVQSTMDWTRVTATFNSQAHSEVLLYLGIWDGKGGKMWWDDISLERLGLMNIVRRPGCPIEVRGDDGTIFEEGKDFEVLTDPKSGNVPWPGEYDVYHESPPIRIKDGGRIKNGQRLHVSYYHAATTEVGKSALCLSEPKSKLLEIREIERIRRIFEPKTFFLAHDEIRVMNWCAACQARKLSPAKLLLDDVLDAIEAMPKEEVLVWSDMFDPSHNAIHDYYLVNGSLKGSWEELPKRLTIVNWNQNNLDSVRIFADRGHRQVLAGYYDGSVETIKDWLQQAKNVKGITGVMYTTWIDQYRDLEAFAKAAWGDETGLPFKEG